MRKKTFYRNKIALNYIYLNAKSGEQGLFEYVALSDPDYMKFQQWFGPFLHYGQTRIQPMWLDTTGFLIDSFLF